MVRIRLMRLGKRKQGTFRLCATDSRNPRDGACLESLGWYNPQAKEDSKRVLFKPERIRHWLSKGALPTEAAASLLRQQKITKP